MAAARLYVWSGYSGANVDYFTLRTTVLLYTPGRTSTFVWHRRPIPCEQKQARPRFGHESVCVTLLMATRSAGNRMASYRSACLFLNTLFSGCLGTEPSYGPAEHLTGDSLLRPSPIFSTVKYEGDDLIRT